MTDDISPAAATAIADLATAWAVYESSEATLTGPRPDPGALLAASSRLRSQMPDFDPATGELPWESDPDLEPEAPEGAPWVSAAFEVLYEVHVLSRPTGMANQAHHLLELGNAIGDLTSWHPAYDGDTGQIAASTTS